MQSPILGKRLKTIAECVPAGEIVADVGCDHGYLAAYLILCRGIETVYASDIHKKPLDAANKTVVRWNLTDRMKLIQADGLTETPQTVTTVVIAGMGGESIIKILEEADWTQRPGMRLVLQPMSFLPKVRSFLYRHGFALQQEIPVIEPPHYYLVMEACYCGEKRELSEREELLGCLETAAGAERDCYLLHEYRKYQKMAEGLSTARGEQEKYRQCLRKLEYLRCWKEETLDDDGKRNL